MRKYKLSNSRLTAIGNYAYLDSFTMPVVYDYFRKEPTEKSEKRKTAEVQDQEACIRKSKKRLRDIIIANSNQYKNISGKTIPVIFITITFALNIQDNTEANKKFNLFIQRYSYLTKTSLKYVAVLERQKRGAIHYHVLFFNLPYVENIQKVTADCWGEGYIFGETENDINKIIYYLSKYIQKEIVIGKHHTKNKRRFLTSKGLLRPISTLDENAIRYALENLPKPVSIQNIEFTDHEGRTVQRSIIELPENSEFAKYLPQKTEKLVKDVFDDVE
jgi:hypothetical protein